MQKCHYNAQGMYVCPVIEGFVNAARTRDSFNLENPDNGLFKRFENASEEADVGHIFSQCDRSTCRATGCETSSQGQRCTVTCKCKRCTNKNNTVKADYKTEGKIWVTGKNAKSVKGLYFCDNTMNLQTQPCKPGISTRVGGYNQSCPVQQSSATGSVGAISAGIVIPEQLIERILRPVGVVGAERVGTESIPANL